MLGTAALCIGVMALAPITQATATAGHAAQAASKPGKPAKPAPPPTPKPGCTLTDPDQPNNEFAYCTIVHATLASSPAAGKPVDLQVTVTSQDDVPSGVLQVGANQSLSLSAPAGFSGLQHSASGVGQMNAVSDSISLAAGQTRTYTFQVQATGKGTGVIQAYFKTGDARTSGMDEVDVDLGAASDSLTSTGDLATVAAPANAQTAPADTLGKYKPAPIDKHVGLNPGAPGADCATGRWVFNDQNGVQTGSANFQVQVWDQDTSGGDDLLATGVTGLDGSYNLCFESTDSDQGGGQEAYVKFISENSTWRVRNDGSSNSNYVFATGVFNYADPGGSHSYGTLQPADGTLHRALHAFNAANKAWLWIVSASSCFDNPGQCRQLIINWTNSSTDGTYYSLGSNDVHLAAADPDAETTVIHEASHATMDAVYNDAFPSAPNCNPHSIFGNSSTGCAWTEGWAEWLPARVLNDPFFRWPSGASLDLENPTWNDGNPHGDQNEGRIAGTLIDLSDSNNEGFWDRYTEDEAYGASHEETFSTALNQVSGTLSEYFNTDRPADGFDVGYLARTAVFANTNDYAAHPQRDPLFNGAELTRPSLSVTPSPHNYSFSTTSGFWSAVGIRGANDNDLTVYDDEAQATALTSSTFGGATPDYVLVDSNSGHRPVGDSYFPRAFLFAGSGGYNVELSQDNATLSTGTATQAFTSGDVLRVRDVSMSSGVPEFFRAVPAAGQDISIHLHKATSTASTWVQPRGSNVAAADSGGAGGAEAFTYTPAADDAPWHAFVVVNKSGSGTVTIYRDQSAPTGSVSINNGAATTTSANVTLSLPATDAQTGVMDMRISVDGTLDTEAFEPYAATKSVTLPAGAGTKTVLVQYRNNAGQAAAPVSDTIDLLAKPGKPTVTSSTPLAGSVRVAFNPPASDGGSPITKYQAQCKSTDGGVTKAKKKPSSPITVDNLTPGKHYRCHVKAINAVGAGPYSAFGATVLVPAALAAREMRGFFG